MRRRRTSGQASAPRRRRVRRTAQWTDLFAEDGGLGDFLHEDARNSPPGQEVYIQPDIVTMDVEGQMEVGPEVLPGANNGGAEQEVEEEVVHVEVSDDYEGIEFGIGNHDDTTFQHQVQFTEGDDGVVHENNGLEASDPLSVTAPELNHTGANPGEASLVNDAPTSGLRIASTVDLEEELHEEAHDVQNEEDEDNSASARNLPDSRSLLKRKRAHKVLLSPGNIAAIHSISADMRMTVKHYNFMRRMVQAACSSAKLPSYFYVQQVLWPAAVRNVFVRSSIENLLVTKGPSAAASEVIDKPTRPVCIILPSQWAIIDVATTPFFSEEYTNNRDAVEDNVLPDLRNCAMVTKRPSVVNQGFHLWGKCGKIPVMISPNSRICITLSKSWTLGEISHWHSLGWDCERLQNPSGVKVNGVSGLTWIAAKETSWESNFPASEEETMIATMLKDRFEEDHILVAQGLNRKSFEANDLRSVVFPGDLCCVIRPSMESCANKRLAIIVSRFRKETNADSTEKLFLLDHPILSGGNPTTAADENNSAARLIFTKKFEFRTPIELSTSLPGDPSNSTGSGQVNASDRGVLQNGDKFVVYRFLLFTDDFSPYALNNPTGSCGGCYLVPCALPDHFRSMSNGVRTVSLTPPGVSTNEVLKIIVKDIIEGTTKGFPAKDMNGEEVTIFLDLVGFVADYPAMTSVTDLMGHTANSPCSHCSFRVRRDRTGSSYGYTTAVHSRKPSHFRCFSNHRSFRISEGTIASFKRLGIQTGNEDILKDKPLLLLADEMRKVSSIPLTGEGLPVVSGVFDPYQCCAIAPDHLLSGIAKDLLQVAFLSVPKASRSHTNVMFKDALQRNALMTQGFLFNSKSDNLHPMTMTAAFCAISIAPAAFRVSWGSMHGDVLEIIDCFSDIVAFVYWIPKLSVDGAMSEEFVGEVGFGKYCSQLLEKGKRYVSLVHALCSSNRTLGEKLDKPNLHRLMELVVHTIPAYGSARNVSEMMFEAAHQPLKAILKRNTHAKAHISAVHHVLCHDWSTRLGVLREISRSSQQKGNVSKTSRRGLARLFVGEHIDSLDENSVEAQEIYEAIDLVMADPLTYPIWERGEYESFWDQIRFEWKVGKEDVGTVGESLTDAFLDNELTASHVHVLQAIQIHRTQQGHCGNYRAYKQAQRVSNIAKHTKRVHKQTTITPGMAVQICDLHGDGDSISEATEGQSIYYCLHCIAACEDGEDIWVGVSKLMKESQKFLYRSNGSAIEDIEVMQLTGGVQRVAAVHACEPEHGCKVINGKIVEHHTDLRGGGYFYIFGRRNGYPPRTG